jgi:hypothetical protein
LIKFENKNNIENIIWNIFNIINDPFKKKISLNFGFKNSFFNKIFTKNLSLYEPGDKLFFSQEKHTFEKVITNSEFFFIEKLTSKCDDEKKSIKCKNEESGGKKIFKEGYYFATVSIGLCIQNENSNDFKYAIVLPGHKVSNTAKIIDFNEKVDADYSLLCSAYPGYFTKEQSYKIFYDPSLIENDFKEVNAISDVSIFEIKNHCDIKQKFKTLSNVYVDNETKKNKK